MILRMSFLLALTLPIIASSQVPNSIHGRVVDSAGMPLLGITVTLEQPKTRLRQLFKTDKNGMYKFDGLANGQYSLMFEGPGLITERIENITYRSPYSFTQDLTLYSSVPLIKGNPQEEEGKSLDPERYLSLPTYPVIASRAAIEGDYEIEMQIEEGRVKNIKIISGWGTIGGTSNKKKITHAIDDVFISSIKNAIRSWQFNPKIKSGAHVMKVAYRAVQGKPEDGGLKYYIYRVEGAGDGAWQTPPTSIIIEYHRPIELMFSREEAK